MHVHPFTRDELAAGRALAESFLERFACGTVESGALAQAVGLARIGSMERLRGFCARLQEELAAGREAA